MNSQFDPNGVGVKGTLFGLPYTLEEAELVVLPIPWDVTVSYGAGTAEGPAAILDASSQIDYFMLDKADAWKHKVVMAEVPEVWQSLGAELRVKAEAYIDWLESGSDAAEQDRMEAICVEINKESTQLMTYVEQEANYYRQKGKKTVLLGGDHSTPLGHIKACIDAYKGEEIGILQIDAHADLREAYEGFTYSHASIMYNVLKETELAKLVQVGIRDLCQAEADIIANDERVTTFYDQKLRERQYKGEYWSILCDEIVASLPQKVYISFDIDGLDPKLCPNTGTPVPGGFEMEEVNYLFRKLKESGREIIGADLVEVGTTEWDANVGARVLWQLVNLFS
ncbi:agmatinase [Roseivirga pacifica]|uniref:Agmatinase n=1 Tax=Roseivirga pacifica TaxID=1267423 RepID=A0A1I0PZQ6_9BACT|nr:agmatinase family protein [Roseivirga pacifica]RKQ43382.1 agmatinase [Roseivirga pacifica]SEW20108.1 agmatinase [Roseivirga pacifica]